MARRQAVTAPTALRRQGEKMNRVESAAQDVEHAVEVLVGEDRYQGGELGTAVGSAQGSESRGEGEGTMDVVANVEQKVDSLRRGVLEARPQARRWRYL